MRGMFTSRVSGVAVTAAQDFFELLAPTTGVVVVHEVILGQTSDAGDAQDELLLVSFTRGIGAVTSGSAGSTPAVGKLEGTGSASSVVEANNTGQMAAGSGSLVVVRSDVMNVRAGYSYLPTPETRIVISPGDRLAIAISAPVDSLTMCGTIVFEECGG